MYAQLLKKGNEIRTEKPSKGLPQKHPTRTKMRQKIVNVGHIGEVAAPFAGDAQLPTGLVHLLKQKDVSSRLGRLARCHHPGSSSSHHYYFLCHCSA
jgi:hypothetical protein